ncbi:hypothetical protein HPB52_004381 [Rhipicephalus sanguineus]|uniref:Uncharacterized protein n=1 Tax=Rhipicephalus sanguineus TaxID=34632 RepID=A0A9D4Q8Q7_RHISA|nr:hypothetical protein HPB52_004381 [Rhipicephalus sanguineus]
MALCAQPLMARWVMPPNQEHRSNQPTTYIVAVVSRTPSSNHLQYCPRGTITGTRCLVEGSATRVRTLCAFTAVSANTWLDSALTDITHHSVTTMYRRAVDKTAGAVVCARCGARTLGTASSKTPAVTRASDTICTRISAATRPPPHEA